MPKHGVHATAVAIALITAVTCGPPGLPPAGPEPGEVEIGYDTKPKEEVTGAVTSIPEDQIGEHRPLRFDELIRGRVPGLTVIPRPDGGYTIRIRGNDSLMSSQEPLIIVDGAPIASHAIDSALAGLTPDDIRQIDVLRDVSATAIYGVRGAGGVIIITTRR